MIKTNYFNRQNKDFTKVLKQRTTALKGFRAWLPYCPIKCKVLLPCSCRPRELSLMWLSYPNTRHHYSSSLSCTVQCLCVGEFFPIRTIWQIIGESWSAIGLRNWIKRVNWARRVIFSRILKVVSCAVCCARSAHRRASETPHYQLYQNLSKLVGGLTHCLILRTLCWLVAFTLAQCWISSLVLACKGFIENFCNISRQLPRRT